jgi:hypothetical protein
LAIDSIRVYKGRICLIMKFKAQLLNLITIMFISVILVMTTCKSSLVSENLEHATLTSNLHQNYINMSFWHQNYIKISLFCNMTLISLWYVILTQSFMRIMIVRMNHFGTTLILLWYYFDKLFWYHFSITLISLLQ